MNTHDDEKSLVERLVKQYVGNADDVDYNTAKVMIAALFLGPNEEKIVQFTGYDPEFVAAIAMRMRASKLWTSSGTDYQQWDPDSKLGFINFAMDLGVAKGELIRTGERRLGHWVHRSTKHRTAHA